MLELRSHPSKILIDEPSVYSIDELIELFNDLETELDEQLNHTEWYKRQEKERLNTMNLCVFMDTELLGVNNEL